MGRHHADSHPPHRRQVRDRTRHAAGLLPSGRRPLRGRRLQWRVASPPRLVLQPQGQPQDQSRGGYPDIHGTGRGAGRHRPGRAVAEAGRAVSFHRRIPGQDRTADSGVHADPPDRSDHICSGGPSRPPDGRQPVCAGGYRLCRCLDHQPVGGGASMAGAAGGPAGRSPGDVRAGLPPSHPGPCLSGVRVRGPTADLRLRYRNSPAPSGCGRPVRRPTGVSTSTAGIVLARVRAGPGP